MQLENGLAKATTYWITGGERGIRTPKRGLDAYTLSRRAPSTTRTPLLNFYQACYLDQGANLSAA